MICPFPGMDPYLERPAIFPDFHDALIYNLRVALQPLLRPKYVAMSQDRLYVVDAERARFPDVSVIRSPRPSGPLKNVGVIEADVPAVFDIWQEEVRQPYLTIVEPAADNRVVTAMEVLSPSNKQSGPGRDSYLEKREELWNSGVNLVEIDLLRAGLPTVRLSDKKRSQLGVWTYLVAVTRCQPPRLEVYPAPLRERLPRIAVPLGSEDQDVVLDMQTIFTRCWAEGPYPEILLYGNPPPGMLTPDDAKWCQDRLQQAHKTPD